MQTVPWVIQLFLNFRIREVQNVPGLVHLLSVVAGSGIGQGEVSVPSPSLSGDSVPVTSEGAPGLWAGMPLSALYLGPRAGLTFGIPGPCGREQDQNLDQRALSHCVPSSVSVTGVA